MNSAVLWTLIIAINLNYGLFENLPSFIKKCKMKDPELAQCLKQRIDDTRPYLIKGIPELKIPPFEPFHVSQLELHTRNGNGFGFNAKFSDLDIFGMQNFKLVEFNMHFEKLMIFVDIQFAQLVVRGQYSFDGTILMMELSGTGAAQINITNVHLWGNRTFSMAKINGMRYLIPEDVTDSRIEYEGISMNFDKLFKDNEVLTRDINKIVNSNYDEIGKELNLFIYEVFYSLYDKALRDLFSKYSLEELFD